MRKVDRLDLITSNGSCYDRCLAFMDGRDDGDFMKTEDVIAAAEIEETPPND